MLSLAAILMAAILSLSFFDGGGSEQSIRNLSSPYDSAVQSGQFARQGGNFSQAMEFYRAALSLAQKMKEVEKEVYCLMILGRLGWSESRLEESQTYYSSAWSIAKKANLEANAEESQIAMNIYQFYSQGKIDRLAGQYEKSIKSLNMAVALSKRIGSKEHEVKCLRQLSQIYLEIQSFESFFSSNTEALKIARELRDKREQLKSLRNLGFYCLKAAEYSRALHHYYEALDLSKELKNREDESTCLKNIGLILMNLGFGERSIDYLSKAFEIDQQIGNESFISMDLFNMGEVLRNNGVIFESNDDLYKALNCFLEVLRIARKSDYTKVELRALNNLGTVYRDLDDFAKALNFFRSAYKISIILKDKNAQEVILNNMGICHFNLKNFRDAEIFLRKAIECGEEIGRDKILWNSYYYLGQCYEEKDDFSQALLCYNRAIDAIDHIRSQILYDSYKAGFVRDKLRVYESLIALLYKLSPNDLSNNFGKEIFYIIERVKARAFLECLGEFKSEISGSSEAEFKKHGSEISNRISQIVQGLLQKDLSQKRKTELQQDLKQAEDEYLQLILRMKAELPGVPEPGFPVPVRLEQVQRFFLDEKTAIMEYFLGEKQSFVFAVTKNQFNFFPLPSRNEIEISIRAYFKILSDPPQGKFRGTFAAKRLAEEFFSPALKILPESVEHLVIIPDDVLYYIPFETLPAHLPSRSSGENYSISRYTISYAPSCSSLLFLKERKRRDRYPKTLLAFGNPSYVSDSPSKRKRTRMMAGIMKELYANQGFDISPLPQSQNEIREISRYFSKTQCDIFLQKDASEDRIKNISLADYQLLHFACHGFLDEKFPFRSALALSQDEDNREDGFLQVREIYGLRLAAELVVLSACHTYQGSLERGEGILGLTRVFFYSGARSVVSTLWKISDKAAARFMRYFYFYLSQKMDKAQALRQAKLKMLRSKYSHPFYWAGFVLNGEYSSSLSFRE